MKSAKLRAIIPQIVIPYEKKQIIKVVNKTEIKKILFHRFDKLLLDKVILTKTHAIGILKIRKHICQGHEINGELIMKGTDGGDMAAQLAGIVAAADPKYSELHDKDIRAEDYEKIHCRKESICRETIFIHMAKKNLKIPKKKKSKRNHIIASHFIIKGGGDKDIKSYIGKLVLLATPKKPKP